MVWSKSDRGHPSTTVQLDASVTIKELLHTKHTSPVHVLTTEDSLLNVSLHASWFCVPNREAIAAAPVVGV